MPACGLGDREAGGTGSEQELTAAEVARGQRRYRIGRWSVRAHGGNGRRTMVLPRTTTIGPHDEAMRNAPADLLAGYSGRDVCA